MPAKKLGQNSWNGTSRLPHRLPLLPSPRRLGSGHCRRMRGMTMTLPMPLKPRGLDSPQCFPCRGTPNNSRRRENHNARRSGWPWRTSRPCRDSDLLSHRCQTTLEAHTALLLPGRRPSSSHAVCTMAPEGQTQLQYAELSEHGGAMPKYLWEASYSAEGAKGLLKDGGSKSVNWMAC